MTYTLYFEIPGLPRIVSNGSHGHWSRAHGERKKWKRLASYAIGFRRPEKPLEKAKCTFIRYSCAKRPDDENLAVSFKSVCDALKECGIIVDDSPEHIVRFYDHKPAKRGEGKITVRVEEI